MLENRVDKIFFCVFVVKIYLDLDTRHQTTDQRHSRLDSLFL